MAPRKTPKTAAQKAVKTLPKQPKEAKAKPEFGPFDFISAVSFDKKDLIRDAVDPVTVAKIYSPFLTNRALSYHVSSIMEANMLNGMGHIDNQLQFDCLLSMVRREKRFSKWFKPEVNETLNLIAEHYQCNKIRAQEILSILTQDQIEMIREQHHTGGASKK